MARTIIRLSIIATALSVSATIIAASFLNGFEQAITNKMYLFLGQVRVQNYAPIKQLISEESPFLKNDTLQRKLVAINGVESVQPFATQSCVVEHHKEIEGLLLKGVESGFPFRRLHSFLQQGAWPLIEPGRPSRQIALSSYTASRIHAHVGDSLRLYVIDPWGRINQRYVQLCAIYKTGIEEYDNLFAIGDIQLLRLLNRWQPNQIGGYEIALSNKKNIQQATQAFNAELPSALIARSLETIYPNLFDWLRLQRINRNVVFITTVLVAVINLITCLLILVLERTKMVGILKAMGSSHWQIQKIFLYYSLYVAVLGIGIGLAVGLGICWVQSYWGVIHLNENLYYVSTAPVLINYVEVLLICIFCFLICFCALLLPSLVVRSVSIVRALQFE